MKYRYLISQSKSKLKIHTPVVSGVVSLKIFDLGARWMFDQLNENISYSFAQFNNKTNYFGYGVFKYGISFLLSIFSAFLFLKLNIFLLPISVIVFYIVEVHFLFLFPMIIDNFNKPVLRSIKATYKIGILKAITTVIPIGIYMVLGLFNIKNPFYNWYVGCLAIVIWYQNEIRNRI